jgi:beta-galactosidase beta subunit
MQSSDGILQIISENGTVEHQIMINKGMFWVAFPQDGHKSVSHSKEPHNFEKIILKLPVK